MGFRLNSRLGCSENAQVALEFVLLISIAFMVMIVFTALAMGSMSNLRGEEEYVLLKDVIHTAQGEIITATIVEDGYKRMFTLPLFLEGISYNITMSGGYIIGQSKNHEYLLKVMDVSGNIQKGVNTIRKQDGAVYLNVQ